MGSNLISKYKKIKIKKGDGSNESNVVMHKKPYLL